ncbi:hypothetical protein AB0I81_45530 [Nonomuraea sp. NPDC050404]|uniref:hypothetical protein n=1 Tax=Nonomuraea sp. NPDC050404 TaxID=3155783 RepID=UPI0033E1F45E
MYKSALAAVTLTAAALLLAATPAIADNDFSGPEFHSCESSVFSKLIKFHAPMLLWLAKDDCADKWDDESMSHLMN